MLYVCHSHIVNMFHTGSLGFMMRYCPACFFLEEKLVLSLNGIKVSNNKNNTYKEFKIFIECH